MIPDERGQRGQRCPAVYPTFGPGGEGVRGVKGGMVRGEVQGSVLVGNTGVGFKKK